MSEYKFFNEFLETVSINPKDIIIQDINITSWGSVDIFIVEKYKDNVYIIVTARGDIYTSITREQIDRVVLGKSQVNKLIDLLLPKLIEQEIDKTLNDYK